MLNIFYATEEETNIDISIVEQNEEQQATYKTVIQFASVILSASNALLKEEVIMIKQFLAICSGFTYKK